MIKFKLFILSFLFISFSGFSQKKKYNKEELRMLKEYYFNEGFNQPARKKVSTLVMDDGTERKGYVRSLRFNRGLVKTVVFKDSVTDKKEHVSVEDINEALFYGGGFEKFLKIDDQISRLGTGKRNNMKKATTADQIYFVKLPVSIRNKKDKESLLMQLLNPQFDDYISVYHDPRAAESGGFSVGGATFGGGIIKSYYVKKGDKIIWLPKKDLKKQYDWLFGDNEEFMKKYPLKSINWDWFSALVLEYTKMSLEQES